MENFIGVVLDTLAEGGDEIQDRLTNLSELCSSFAPLIYQLDKMKSTPKVLHSPINVNVNPYYPPIIGSGWGLAGVLHYLSDKITTPGAIMLFRTKSL